MARCKYVNEDGTRCYCKGGSVKWEGLCWGHALKTGFITKEKKEKIRQKIIKKHKENKLEKEKNPGKALRKKHEGAKLSTQLCGLASLALGSGFDAGAAYESIKTLNPIPEEVRGAEMFLFSLWALSPSTKRRPRNIVDFSTLVNLPVSCLESWLRSDWIQDIWRQERTRYMLSYGHLIDLQLVKNALAGDRYAIDKYYELFPLKSRKIIKEKLKGTFIVNPEAQQIADEMVKNGEIGGKTGIGRVKGVTKTLENTVLQNQLLEAMQKVELEQEIVSE